MTGSCAVRLGAGACGSGTSRTPKNLVTFAAGARASPSCSSRSRTTCRPRPGSTWVKSVGQARRPRGHPAAGRSAATRAGSTTRAAAVAWQDAALVDRAVRRACTSTSSRGSARTGTPTRPAVRRGLPRRRTTALAGARRSLPLEADVSFWLWTPRTADGTAVDAAVLAARRQGHRDELPRHRSPARTASPRSPAPHRWAAG